MLVVGGCNITWAATGPQQRSFRHSDIQTFRHSDIQTHTTGRQRSWSGLAGHDEFCLCWRLSLWLWLCLLFLRPPPVAACASPLCVHAVLCACRFDMVSIFYCLPRASEVSQEPYRWKA